LCIFSRIPATVRGGSPLITADFYLCFSQ